MKQAFKKLHEKDTDLDIPTGRAIVTFGSISDVKQVKNHFKLSCMEELAVKTDLCGASHMYVDPMPKPD